MKPSHVNFFDGMRVSAEHMDHLQGSLHSAIADLRGVAGLGRVHEGFEVVANGDGTVTVQPGLAFDFQRNRIVCQEPRVVTPSFESGQSAAYVCVEYTSTSSGIVEDIPTLIWDGCRTVVRAERPSREENQVTLARIRLLPDGVSVQVEALPNAAANGPAAVVSGTAGDRSPATSREEPPLRVSQGIASLSAPDGGLPLADLAIRIGEASGGAATGETGIAAVPVGSADAALPFLWQSLSWKGAIRLWWGSAADGGPGPESTATVIGEATYGPEGLSQHSLQTLIRGAGSVGPKTGMLANSIAQWPLSSTALPEGSDSGSLGRVLDRLELRLWVATQPSEGFEVKATIDWKGGIDERALRTLADSPRTLAWEATLGWKALGRA